MTVYVDDMRRPAKVGRLSAHWSHLTADTKEELHRFALQIGLARAWFQDKGNGLWHYDVTDSKRQAAIRLGRTWETGFQQIGYLNTDDFLRVYRKDGREQ